MTSLKLNTKEKEVIKLLLNYMRSHPEAKHTAEGITRWWFLQQKIEEEVNTVNKVLKFLTTQNLIEKVTLPGQTSYYRFSVDKIDAYLSEMEEWK